MVSLHASRLLICSSSNRTTGPYHHQFNKKAQLTPRSARDSSAAWWIGIQYRQWLKMAFLARDSIYAIARYMPSPVRPSVRLSVTRVDQSKTFEVRITQPSPQSSPMALVSWRGTAPWNSSGKIGSGGAKYERGMKKRHFSHCRYCIPIHQAALLSRADRGVSRAFLFLQHASVVVGWFNGQYNPPLQCRDIANVTG